jgi:hypothetical protein
MIAQLAPTFERLNGSIAYHRDVNARNLLVHYPLDGSPDDRGGPLPVDVSSLEFTILDFGSSTDARAWLGAGEGSWQVENPTGDARYWGPASWVRFLGGPQALSAEASLLRQYTRRLDIFALAVCTLELLVKLHNVDYPSEACMRNLGENRNAEVQLAQCVWRAHSSWNSYWNIAVSSFDRLAEYSRLSCMGDQAQALQIWQSLCASHIPETMSQKLHELCGDLHYLAEVCRHMPGGAACGTWAQVGSTLSGLLDMVHFNGTLEWAELMQRVGPPMTKRPGMIAGSAGASWPVRIDEAKPSPIAGTAAATNQIEAARQQPEMQYQQAVQGNGSGSSLSVPAAGSASTPNQAGMPGQVSLVKAFAMPDAAVPEASSAITGLVGPAESMSAIPALVPIGLTSSPTSLPAYEGDGGYTQGAVAVADESAAFASETSPLRTPGLATIDAPSVDLGCRFSPVSRQRAVPASATHGEFAVAVPPSFASSIGTSTGGQAVIAGVPGNSPKKGEHFEVYEDPKAASPAILKGLQSAGQSPAGGFQNSSGAARVFEHPEEREHEALRILRQVESEVRTLKRWYTEAIEAMRSPNPFPPSEGM